MKPVALESRRHCDGSKDALCRWSFLKHTVVISFNGSIIVFKIIFDLIFFLVVESSSFIFNLKKKLFYLSIMSFLCFIYCGFVY